MPRFYRAGFGRLIGPLTGLLIVAAIAVPRAALAQQTADDTKGKNCRMEQQCHWKDFKKVCVWVKVCR